MVYDGLVSITSDHIFGPVVTCLLFPSSFCTYLLYVQRTTVRDHEQLARREYGVFNPRDMA